MLAAVDQSSFTVPIGIAITAILSAASIVISILQWITGRGAAKQQQATSDLVEKLNRSEDKRNADVQALSDSLHATAEKLVDERFRGVSHSIKNHVHTFTLTLQAMGREMEEAKKNFASLFSADSHHGMKLVEEVAALKEFVRGCTAGKEEFVEFRRETMKGQKEIHQHLTQLERSVLTAADLRKAIQELKQ